MIGLVVTTDNAMYEKEFSEPYYVSMGEVVKGPIEIVKPQGLEPPLIMVVNEEGLCDNLDLNFLGSILYGTFANGQPIVGNIILCQTVNTPDGPDIGGLDEEELENIKEQIFNTYNFITEKEK